MLKNLLNALDVNIKLGFSHNHQSNPIERFHRTLWALLRAKKANGENDWEKSLPTLILAYNATQHFSTNSSPARNYLLGLIYLLCSFLSSGIIEYTQVPAFGWDLLYLCIHLIEDFVFRIQRILNIVNTDVCWLVVYSTCNTMEHAVGNIAYFSW